MQEIIQFSETHWILTTALIVVLFLLICIEFVRQKRGTGRLSPAQLTHLINHENAVVVDLRDSEAFSSGHIVDAISLPMKDLEGKYKKIEKFKSQPIVLVCASGADSPRAAPILIQKGFKVFMLNNGLRSWRDAGMPLIKG